jgi:predicted nucleic acid-binding Zn ribbon protein
MFKLFKQLFRVIASLVGALEKGAQALENIASAAEKTSEAFLVEERLRNQERLAKLRRLHAPEQLSATVRTELASSPSSVQTGHAVTQTAPPIKRVRELAAAGITLEAETATRRALVGSAAGANSSRAWREVSPYVEAIEVVERPSAPIEDNRQSSSLLRRRGDDRAASLRSSEAREIEELVARRGISSLVHFTREVNLPSILQRGLVTRDVLREGGQENNCNDPYRLDGTDAVCVSIEFPNYKMFYALRQENKNVDWILILIDASVLWTTTVAFCTANAASKLVTEVPLRQRMGPAAMEAMFSDFGHTARAALSLPDSFPTNPQAEALLLDGAPRRYISGVIARDCAQKARIEAYSAGLKVVSNADWFRWRSDYEQWR